jgi:hypothetical protein
VKVKPKVSIIENLKQEMDAMHDRILFLLRVEKDARMEIFNLYKVSTKLKQSVRDIINGRRTDA